MAGEKGWVVTDKEATYFGFWFRINVHLIFDTKPDEWFVTADAIGIDCVPLQARSQFEARCKALQIVNSMLTKYLSDYIKANQTLEQEREKELSA